MTTEEQEDVYEDLACEMSLAMPVVVLDECYIHRVSPPDRRVRPGKLLELHHGDVPLEIRVNEVTDDVIGGRIEAVQRRHPYTPKGEELPLGRRVSLRALHKFQLAKEKK